MKKNGTKIFMSILAILIICACVILGYKIITKEKKKTDIKTSDVEDKNNVLVAEVKEKKVDIFKGDDRPIAVMIDNHNLAWAQSGLNKAYMVYEIIVEGGETRLMALFKNQDVDEIGPVRSARHYFIDYAMENDAIYVHFGQSPQAKNDLRKYYINDIDGIAEDGVTFWRTRKKTPPHNALTSIEKIIKSAKNKKYRITSNKKSVLKYSTEEVNLEKGNSAKSITIPHSDLQKVKYVYDEESGKYKRYARNKVQKDAITGEAVTTKNIIVTLCDNYTLNDKENKGRQGLKNIGTFDGYYLTNGKVIKIKCEKNKRDEKTKYLDLNGNEIEVNDGNTWINICPKNANILIES